MGADLLIMTCPVPAGIHERPSEARAELERRIAALPNGRLDEVAQQRLGLRLDPGQTDEDDETSPAYVRTMLVDALGVLFEGRRDCTDMARPDGGWDIVSGGMSGGDSPTESYNDIEVLQASGICEAPMPWVVAPLSTRTTRSTAELGQLVLGMDNTDDTIEDRTTAALDLLEAMAKAAPYTTLPPMEGLAPHAETIGRARAMLQAAIDDRLPAEPIAAVDFDGDVILYGPVTPQHLLVKVYIDPDPLATEPGVHLANIINRNAQEG